MKLSSEIYRIYKGLHTWAGIISSLFLFICFYAGALTVFETPMNQWATPPSQLHTHTIPIEKIPEVTAKLSQQNPDFSRHFYLYLPQKDHPTYQLVWQVKDKDADEHNNADSRFYTASQSADGDMIIQQIFPSRINEFIDVLHRVAGLPSDTDINRWIIGVIVTLYALALLSGLIILLPTLIKDLFALRLNGQSKRVWLDAHNIVGIGSLPFHFVIAMTSFVFIYHDLIYGTQNQLIHEGKLRQALMSGMSKPVPNQPTDPIKMVSPEKIISAAKKLSPTFEPYMLEYTALTTPAASVRIWGHDDYAIEPRPPGGFIPMNPYIGEAQTTAYLPGRQDAASTLLASFFAMHMATYGGSPLRWIYFFLGLAGAWLFFTGNLLWIESRRNRQRRGQDVSVQRKDVSVMTAMTIGVSFGAINGISLMLASSKWLSQWVTNPYPAYQVVYYFVFFLCIFWSLFRGQGKSLTELLYLTTFTYLCIPFTSLLGYLFPVLGLWTHTTPTALAVDATALMLSLVFLYVARITHKKTMQVEMQDSVWIRN